MFEDISVVDYTIGASAGVLTTGVIQALGVAGATPRAFIGIGLGGVVGILVLAFAASKDLGGNGDPA